ELALRLAAVALEAPDLALHAAQPILDGLHEPLDLLRAPGHLARGPLLLGPAGLRQPLRPRIPGLLPDVERERPDLVPQGLVLAQALLRAPRAAAAALERQHDAGA